MLYTIRFSFRKTAKEPFEGNTFFINTSILSGPFVKKKDLEIYKIRFFYKIYNIFVLWYHILKYHNHWNIKYMCIIIIGTWIDFLAFSLHAPDTCYWTQYKLYFQFQMIHYRISPYSGSSMLTNEMQKQLFLGKVYDIGFTLSSLINTIFNVIVANFVHMFESKSSLFLKFLSC